MHPLTVQLYSTVRGAARVNMHRELEPQPASTARVGRVFFRGAMGTIGKSQRAFYRILYSEYTECRMYYVDTDTVEFRK